MFKFNKVVEKGEVIAIAPFTIKTCGMTDIRLEHIKVGTKFKLHIYRDGTAYIVYKDSFGYTGKYNVVEYQNCLKRIA